jgi:hypothetical protein
MQHNKVKNPIINTIYIYIYIIYACMHVNGLETIYIYNDLYIS